MNKAEEKLYALFVAELMKNKVLLDNLWDEPQHMLGLGEFEVEVDGAMAVGPILYDPTKADPRIREDILENE